MKVCLSFACFLLSLSGFAQQNIHCEISPGEILTITFDEKDVNNLDRTYLKDTWNHGLRGKLTSVGYSKTNVTLELSAPGSMMSELTFDKRNLGEELEFDATYVYRNPSTYSNDWSVVCSSSIQ